MAGQYDTQFIEQRFSMKQADRGRRSYPNIAAIISTLVAHQEMQRSAHVIQHEERDTSNWKWVSRWERMNR
jgi:hypothetical protein